MEATLTESSTEALYRIDADGRIRQSDRHDEIVDRRIRTHVVTCGGCGHDFPLWDLFSHDCTPGAPADRRDVQTVPADTPDRTRPQGDGSGTRRPPEPSKAQADLIRKLLAELGAEHAAEVDFAGLTGGRSGTASALIEHLLAQVKHKRAHRPEAEQVRRNRYAGPCHLCGNTVEAEAGELKRGPAGWLIAHVGGCPTPAPASPEPQGPQADVPAGHYAVASTGHNDLAFYRVDRPTEGAYAGRVFVKLVVGGHPDRNVPRSHVAGILARIAEDPEGAGRRYGQEIGRCCRCNRHLTDETSREAGIGPECAKASG